MAFDEGLAERVAGILGDDPEVARKRMFGGLAFLICGHMSVGVLGDDLVVRVGANGYEEAVARDGARPFDLTGRPMRGWVVVTADAVAEDADLAAWVERGSDLARSLPPK